MKIFIKQSFMLIAVPLLLSMPVYSEVAGIEFKATLRNFNIGSYNLHLDQNASCFMHFSSDYGDFAIDMREFIKPDIEIPLKPNIILRTYSNGFVEDIQNISISKYDNGTFYDYLNIYGTPLAVRFRRKCPARDRTDCGRSAERDSYANRKLQFQHFSF